MANSNATNSQPSGAQKFNHNQTLGTECGIKVRISVKAGTSNRGGIMYTDKRFRLPALGLFAVLTLAGIAHPPLLNSQTLDRLGKGPAHAPAAVVNPLKISSRTEASVSTAGTVKYDFVTIDVPGFPTSVYGINDEELLSGFYGPYSNLHGFFIRDNVLQQVDYPGSGFTAFGAIDNRGVLIGNYGDSLSTPLHAFFYDTNRRAGPTCPIFRTTLRTSGTVSTTATKPPGEHVSSHRPYLAWDGFGTGENTRFSRLPKQIRR